MYRDKLIKYSQKYDNLFKKMNGGIRHTHILLAGTSSVGKTTLSKIFEENGYKIIVYDDYHDDKNKKNKITIEVEKMIDQHDYFPRKKRLEMRDNLILETMYNEAKGKDAVYDCWTHDIKKLYKSGEKLFIIIVYASLKTMMKNAIRRRFTEPRRKDIIKQYAERYVADDNNTNQIDIIDIINRKDIKEYLKENMKYFFDSEEDLEKYTNEAFEMMGINDDEYHKIKVNDKFEYDYLVKTDEKTPEEIFEDLKQFIE
jgi:dephospho-CoA kinase